MPAIRRHLLHFVSFMAAYAQKHPIYRPKSCHFTQKFDYGASAYDEMYITQALGRPCMTPIVGAFLSILSTMTGQLGPNYDPLFYDVMIYIFGTIMFTVFLLGIIAFWLRVHGWGYKDNRERWIDELDRHFEREGIGLIPDNGKYW